MGAREGDTKLGTVDVPAREFETMGRVREKLGSHAVVRVQPRSRDHAAAAIQLLSDDIFERRVYKHLGWREYRDQRAFLHAGGAISSSGPSIKYSSEQTGGRPAKRWRLTGVTKGSGRAP